MSTDLGNSMTASDFREYLFPPDDPRITGLKSVAAQDYLDAAKKDAFAGPMIEGWAKLYPEPFHGVTSDGQIREGLFELTEVPGDLAAPVAAMVSASAAFLATLSSDEVVRVAYPVDAHEWRSWANPEFTQFPVGLRLENLRPEQREAALAIVTASLSETGGELVRTLMRVNAFLGSEVGLPHLMNEFSYQFAIYGSPSVTAPWGWSLFGHHAAVNCVVVGGQMVLTPVFLGGEPSRINDGPMAGTRLFEERIIPARRLMEALTTEVRDRVILFREMVDPSMPEGRIHPGDERHLGGCFQDNRVIPLEGVPISELGEAATEQLMLLVDAFISIMPDGAREVRRREVEAHLDETWFSWIGGWGEDEPFYYRIQGPVAMFELDHHTGVFLSNRTPAPFHIHTVMRTPNGNDYGRVLVRQALNRQLAP